MARITPSVSHEVPRMILLSGGRSLTGWVIAKTCCEGRSAHQPPRFHAGRMMVHSNINVPAFPLLRIESALTLLKPCIFEKFECREDKRHRPDAIFFGCIMPVFGDNRKGPHRFWIISLGSKQIDERVRKRIDDYRTH